jgi:CheY-like chemotaxis protein
MTTKVLVFESDPAFAGELRTELGKLGCATTVVDDGNVGLQQASADRPDLILLSIELPRMNGFSVCNKLKKDPSLKEVPLIIMSTESSDETFDQHKKLRTRAEDYVHKPIAFGELLRHIQGFVPLSPAPHESDGMIVIDDEIEIGADYLGDEEAEDRSGEIPAPAATSRRVDSVDADVDAFAESAFGRLTEPEAYDVEAHAPRNGAATRDSSSAIAPLVAKRPPSARPAAPTVDPVEHERLREELGRVKERFDNVDRAFEEARNELDQVRAEAAESLRRAREIEELKSKLASSAKGGTVSSREFLDLREALNRKDKEVLSLKEQLAKKDRQIVETQDRSLASERAHADLDGRLLSLERELEETREKAESLAADRDLAKRASEDFRTRLEKSRGESDAKDRQIAEQRARHADELAAAENGLAALRAELDQTLANERAEHARALDQSEERRRVDLERATSDHENALVALRGQWEQELERGRADAARVEQAALEELTARLQIEGARAIAEANELAARASVEAAAARDEAASLRQAKDDLESKLVATESRLGVVEAELGAGREELTEARHKLAAQSARLDKARAKWQADRQSLERAKDALAIALAQIEEAEEHEVD